MMSTLVSIIIPVYNLENYIENCLNSVVNQTYRELEILCIDDGSTDKSAEKIKAFAERDSRVKYLYQENAGVSAARNKGLDEATGEYVMFVDGDDYIHFQTVEILLKEIAQSGYDMVCANYTFTSILNEKMVPIDEYNAFNIKISDVFCNSIDYIYKMVWGKLFKTSIAKKVRFPVGISNDEDRYYMIMLFENEIRIKSIDVVLYFYFNRENSATSSTFKMKNMSVTHAFDMLCDHFICSDNEVLKAHCLQYLFQTILFNRTRAVGTKYEKQVLSECKKIGRKWIKSFMENGEIKISLRIAFFVFFYSRPIYEFVRMVQDPAMLDFYKSRKKRDYGEA